ncbi:sulfatase-like hydrolase/transferase [Candidatus Bathyarchaeota archaeon]|nr:sulfatase-like hydrolase/transferase [Candidatus Bathyarchaeota archaeon]
MQRPNIIFIIIDDMGWRDLTCYGSSFYETPNIDSLASDGMMFTDAYAACPVCSPTRASIMTGKYPARLGTTNYFGAMRERGKLLTPPYIDHLPDGEITVAKALQDAGYATYHVGKWHLGPEEYWPEHVGFQVNVGGCSWGNPKHGYFSPYKNPRLDDGPRGEYLTDRLTTEAIQLIQSDRKGNPFFMYLSYYAVHVPIQAPEHVRQKYVKKAKEMGLASKDPFQYGDYFPCEHKKDMRMRRRLFQSDPTYAAMIDVLDTNIGRLLATLEELDILDETIIFFFSDNGGLATGSGTPTCNKPLAEGKGWMYEGGVRDPLIVKWPGVVKPGTKCGVPVTSTDFYPTILEMAGLPPMTNQHVDGVSLLPLLKGSGEGALDREAIYWHYPHYGNQGGTPGSSIRYGDFKLIEFFEDNHVELYDLGNDIGVEHDLASEMGGTVMNMKQLLHEWQQEMEALFPEPNPDYPYYLYKHFIKEKGRLVLNDDGAACIEIHLSPQNPELYKIPLNEIIDYYLGKDTIFIFQGQTMKGTFHAGDSGKLSLRRSQSDEIVDVDALLTPLLGKIVSIKAWKRDDSEKHGDLDASHAVRVSVPEDPSL